MTKKPLLAGCLFGLLAPPVGLFIGLQVSPAMANVLMFPVIIVGVFLDTPLGDMSAGLWVGMVVLSGIVWALLFAAGERLIRLAVAR